MILFGKAKQEAQLSVTDKLHDAYESVVRFLVSVRQRSRISHL